MRILYIAYDKTVSENKLKNIAATASKDCDAFTMAKALGEVDEHTANNLAALMLRADELWLVGDTRNLQHEIAVNNRNRLMGPRKVVHL